MLDNWLLMEPDGSPLFLDASHAFGGDRWPSEPLGWDPAAVGIRSPYLDDFLICPSAHEPWLRRLVEVDPCLLAGAFDGLPRDWGLDGTRVQEARRLIEATRGLFIPEFRGWIEWEEQQGA